MPRGKKPVSKKSDKLESKNKTKKESPEKEEHEVAPEEEETEGDAEGFAVKEKAPLIIEIEERDDVVTPIDKLVADPLLDAASLDGADDDLIDEEELDPFGDKWEA
jgi:hypothetical protein